MTVNTVVAMQQQVCGSGWVADHYRAGETLLLRCGPFEHGLMLFWHASLGFMPCALRLAWCRGERTEAGPWSFAGLGFAWFFGWTVLTFAAAWWDPWRPGR
ncbi:MAG: hypothetical protein OXE76_04590 [Alphaproteobacteria bacterium]|nr:hypothetical protein [Alphaproteobacteria bacterium]